MKTSLRADKARDEDKADTDTQSHSTTPDESNYLTNAPELAVQDEIALSEEDALVTTASPPVLLDEVYGNTIVAQLADTIPCSPTSADHQVLLDEAVAAYKLMNPADPADSAICRFIVALTNTGMDSLKRATAEAGLPLIQERDLKLGMKAATTLVELIKAFDSRPGRKPPNVSVGQVNVQSGGQAIVGNVSHPNAGGRAPCSPIDEDDANEAA